MATKRLVHWTRQAVESKDVWSSPSDGALRVIMRRSPVEAGGTSSSLIDRLLPVVTLAILAVSGLIIGWVLFVP